MANPRFPGWPGSWDARERGSRLTRRKRLADRCRLEFGALADVGKRELKILKFNWNQHDKY